MSNNNLMCFRPLPDQRARVEALCTANGITFSDWIRGVIDVALDGQMSDTTGGFAEARRFGLRIARLVLEDVLKNFPDSLEEAIARYGDGIGPG